MENNIVKQLQEITKNAEAVFKNEMNDAELKEFEAQLIGKKGSISALLKQLKDLTPEEKKVVAPMVQQSRAAWAERINALKKARETEQMNRALAVEWVDVTKKPSGRRGSVHPISALQREIEELFVGMGFMIADGPHIESEWHNFDALNIPPTHPARDMQDTFWVKTGAEDTKENFVLRTHTSSVQIRAMMEHEPPLRVLAPGRVFRNEAVDATHDSAFYQIEGLVVDKGITMSHMKGMMELMLSKIFQQEITARMRPAFFPFVEPGVEMDILYTDRNGKEKWMEVVGAGMVHPNVLKNCGVDPKEHTGFAFGFGLTRLCMLKYGIADIRYLFSMNSEALGQF